MRTGEVEANLVRLDEEAKLSHVTGLIMRKTHDREQSTLADNDFALHEREYARLRAEFEAAHEASHLPEGTNAAPALEPMLIRIRMSHIG